LRSGGTVAWRFNNPGNMRPPSRHVKTAIGIGNTASGDFFIFPDYATGRAEKKALLRRKYNNHTIASAMQIYAPPNENDTEAYIDFICHHTGFSRGLQLSSMSDSQLDMMMDVMEKREGYHAKSHTRHEQWVNTALVTLSDGAQPIRGQSVVVESDGTQRTLKSNPRGQLLIPYEKIGQEIKFFIPDTQEGLKEVGALTTQRTSSAYVLFHNVFSVTAIASTHYADDPKRNESKTPFSYKIIAGDTLGGIAKKFGTTVEQLRKDNGLGSTRIFAGDFLMIHGPNPARQRLPAGNVLPAPNDARRAIRVDRSKLGQGHPLALIPATSQQAPWMEKALDQAKYWHGRKEDVITTAVNYHRDVGAKLKSLAGSSNAWCASFVNWCLMQAGYPITETPTDSQSFRWSKNFIKIDVAIFGAIAVYEHANGGHAAFVYAKTAGGDPILLGGNQSDTINFALANRTELKGFFVPASYLKFANAEIAKGAVLETTTPTELNAEFNIQFRRKRYGADR